MLGPALLVAWVLAQTAQPTSAPEGPGCDELWVDGGEQQPLKERVAAVMGLGDCRLSGHVGDDPIDVQHLYSAMDAFLAAGRLVLQGEKRDWAPAMARRLASQIEAAAWRAASQQDFAADLWGGAMFPEMDPTALDLLRRQARTSNERALITLLWAAAVGREYPNANHLRLPLLFTAVLAEKPRSRWYGHVLYWYARFQHTVGPVRDSKVDDTGEVHVTCTPDLVAAVALYRKAALLGGARGESVKPYLDELTSPEINVEAAEVVRSTERLAAKVTWRAVESPVVEVWRATLRPGPGCPRSVLRPFEPEQMTLDKRVHTWAAPRAAIDYVEHQGSFTVDLPVGDYLVVGRFGTFLRDQVVLVRTQLLDVTRSEETVTVRGLAPGAAVTLCGVMGSAGSLVRRTGQADNAGNATLLLDPDHPYDPQAILLLAPSGNSLTLARHLLARPQPAPDDVTVTFGSVGEPPSVAPGALATWRVRVGVMKFYHPVTPEPLWHYPVRYRVLGPNGLEVATGELTVVRSREWTGSLQLTVGATRGMYRLEVTDARRYKHPPVDLFEVR